MKLFVWLLQRVAEMVRNPVLIMPWPTLRRSWLRIFRTVSVVSFKIFATVVVACRKQEQSETVRDDQRDMTLVKLQMMLSKVSMWADS